MQHVKASDMCSSGRTVCDVKYSPLFSFRSPIDLGLYTLYTHDEQYCTGWTSVPRLLSGHIVGLGVRYLSVELFMVRKWTLRCSVDVTIVSGRSP